MVVATATDEALLEMARAVMTISLRAADRIGALSVVQLRALGILARHGTANLPQLAREIGVTVPTASRLVDRLIAAGLIDRRAAAHSRREIRLHLTDHGRKILADYDQHRLYQLRRCLVAVNEQDRPALLTLLIAMSAAAHHVVQDPPGSG